MNYVLLMAAAVEAGTPLLFAMLGEIITEKVGNLNLGVEGLMLVGAVVAFLAALNTQDPYITLLLTVLAGITVASVYALLTVTLRANQTVSGLALTIFGMGLASFAGHPLLGSAVPQRIKAFFVSIEIPLLNQIPFVGDIFFKRNILVYLGYLAAIIVGIYLYNTKKGLCLRAVGENPAASDAAGISVTAYKYFHILAGGALCSLGGAYLSLVYVPAWQENITMGKGWIAVALVIVSMWNPYRAIIIAYIFGGLDIIGFRLQKFDIPISQYLIDMLPYLATIFVLVFTSVRRLKEHAPPKSLGVPYFREER